MSLKDNINKLPVLKEHELFIALFEKLQHHYPDKTTAYEQAEQSFQLQTAKGFGTPFRKYDYAEVFFTIYSRLKRNERKI